MISTNAVSDQLPTTRNLMAANLPAPRDTRVSFPPTATLRRLCPIEPDRDNSRR
jgi:hypothetical protein